MPYYSTSGMEFRDLMTAWDKHRLVEAINDHKNRIKALIEGGPMILFMKHKKSGDLFGADEPSRVIFARMMNPGEDESQEWADQANFMATNLCKMFKGDGSPETVFTHKDLDNLDVIEDKDKLVDMLMSAMKGGSATKKEPVIIQMPKQDSGGIQFGQDFNEL